MVERSLIHFVYIVFWVSSYFGIIFALSYQDFKEMPQLVLVNREELYEKKVPEHGYFHFFSLRQDSLFNIVRQFEP